MIYPKLKLTRAKMHLDALNQFVEKWIASEPFEIYLYDDVRKHECKLLIKMGELPFEAALIAGDFICCLRSSLDYLAWQLATLTTTKPSNKVCFPIYGKDSPGTQVSIKKSTVGIPENAISIIKSFQPYHAGDAYKTSPLWILNKMWNIDKHRHIVLHSGAVELRFTHVTVEPLRFDKIGDLGIFTFPISVKPNLSIDSPPSVAVKFGDDNEGMVVTLQGCLEIYKFISETVFPEFERFFTDGRYMQSRAGAVR